MCEEKILIDPNQVQAYAQVVVQSTKQAADAVGDELLVGPSGQDFCACGELRSTIPWVDSELTEIHDQVIRGLNRIAGAAADALQRSGWLQQEENVAADVGTPGAPSGTAPTGVPVSVPTGLQVNPTATMTANELANWSANQQFATDMFNKTLNMMGTPNAMLLPDGVDELGFDNDGNMTYTGPSGIGESTDPYSLDLD